MKINIYKNKKLIKTYEADVSDLPFGIMEDLAEVFDFEKLITGTEEEKASAVLNFLRTSKKAAHDLLSEIFPEITDDEIRNARITDVAEVLTDALAFSTDELLTGIKRSKNAIQASRT